MIGESRSPRDLMVELIQVRLDSSSHLAAARINFRCAAELAAFGTHVTRVDEFSRAGEVDPRGAGVIRAGRG